MGIALKYWPEAVAIRRKIPGFFQLVEIQSRPERHQSASQHFRAHHRAGR